MCESAIGTWSWNIALLHQKRENRSWRERRNVLSSWWRGWLSREFWPEANDAVLMPRQQTFAMPSQEQNIYRYSLSFKNCILLIIVNLQYCVSFRYKQSDSVTMYINKKIYIFFFRFFAIVCYHKTLNRVPSAIQKDLVVYPSCM